ncbi:MAG TPA: cyclic nucleotide-binding domain-containing protein, partial [Thermoanaerobaculia bacterium]|nr:cyclic nucleotide-binding domain-containing protein [Thermoanaerobaculia bacterium]
MPTPYNLPIEDHCTECSLRPSRPFCNMSDDVLATLDGVKFTGIYPKGSMLFVEGEQPRGVFILCSGKAKLTTTSAEGRTLIVRIAVPGEVLG